MTRSTLRARARLGILVPYTNTNLEPDMALMCPDTVTLHFARLGGYDQDEIPDEAQMQSLGASDLDDPLRLLMGVRPDVILYGCTSATLSHGLAFDRALADRIGAAGRVQTVTAAGAVVHAVRSLGARKVAFASPYVPAINALAVQFLKDAGITVVAEAAPDVALDNYGQGALDPQAVFDLGRAADHPDAEAIILSCTDMRSVETLARLEEALQKPVISSNQAMLFQALRCVGITAPVPGFGRLLEGQDP